MFNCACFYWAIDYDEIPLFVGVPDALFLDWANSDYNMFVPAAFCFYHNGVRATSSWTTGS